MSRILSYLRYFLYRVNEHSLHSPLVYDLYLKIIKQARKQPLDAQIEKQKAKLRRSKEQIEVTDYGVGKSRNKIRKVSSIARKSLTPGWRSVLLQNLASYFQCKEILELGTSLGTNTLYLSRTPDAIVTTFEGCPNVAGIASSGFESLEQRNIRLVTGNIDETLPSYLDRSDRLDFVYFDANHAYEPTLRYYELCLKKAHDHSIFVFDDIHYSSEMERAWFEIKKNVEVRLSIDIFHMGILVFDPALIKQDFVLSC